jgi:hypothetical protein
VTNDHWLTFSRHSRKSTVQTKASTYGGSRKVYKNVISGSGSSVRYGKGRRDPPRKMCYSEKLMFVGS